MIGNASHNDWRMVRMYELMEDFEEVLSRAPISVSSHQDTMLGMGGRIEEIRSGIAANGASDAEEADAVRSSKSSQKQRQQRKRSGGGGGGEDDDAMGNEQKDDPAIFTAGNCLSSGCCYTSSSTESDTVQPDQSSGIKSTSKYKKQRERLLSRPTL